MDIDSLRAFVSVVDLGSFTKAGRKLYITQSAVSQKIKRLETLYKKQLLSRDGNYIPTRYGELLYSHSKRILSEYDELMSRLEVPDATGEIRFGLPEDFASFFLQDILVKYKNIHPDVFLHVECDLTLNLYDKFNQGGYDLILVKTDAPENLPPDVEILEEELVWVGKTSLLSTQKKVPLVLAPKPCVYRSRATNSLSDIHIPWDITFSSASFASIVAAVSAGVGITVLPQIMVPKSCSIINDDRLPKLSNTHIALLKNKPNNPILNSFESFVIRKLKAVL